MTDETELQYESLKKRFESIEIQYSSLQSKLGKYFKIFRPNFSDKHWRELLDISEKAYELTNKAPIENGLWSKVVSFSIQLKHYTRDSKNAERCMDEMLPKSKKPLGF